jgi:hypothetical protein
LTGIVLNPEICPCAAFQSAMTIYITAPSDSSRKRYTWNAKSGAVCRVGSGLFFDPPPIKIGVAHNLEHALSIIKSHHGGSRLTVEVKED